MAASEKKPDRLKETYDRIRKPVPPPSFVQKDRRREKKEKLVEREADVSLREEETDG